MVKYTLEFCPREQIKACITHDSTLGRGQHKMPASLLDVHCYRPTEHSSFPFSAPPPMPSIPHCHVHMWALAAAGVLCQSHPRALARKAARHQAAWSQGTACVPHHICQRWISFQQHWAKKWQLHGLSCGMLSAFILKFNFLVPGCALFFVFLFVSLFATAGTNQKERHRQGRAQGSAIPSSSAVFSSSPKDYSVPYVQQKTTTVQCSATGKAPRCPWGNKELPPVFSIANRPCAALVFIILLGWAWSVKESSDWAFCPTALHHPCCRPREVAAQNAALLHPSMVLSRATSAIFRISKDQLKAALLVETSGKEQE